MDIIQEGQGKLQRERKNEAETFRRNKSQLYEGREWVVERERRTCEGSGDKISTDTVLCLARRLLVGKLWEGNQEEGRCQGMRGCA